MSSEISGEQNYDKNVIPLYFNIQECSSKEDLSDFYELVFKKFIDAINLKILEAIEQIQIHNYVPNTCFALVRKMNIKMEQIIKQLTGNEKQELHIKKAGLYRYLDGHKNDDQSLKIRIIQINDKVKLKSKQRLYKKYILVHIYNEDEKQNSKDQIQKQQQNDFQKYQQKLSNEIMQEEQQDGKHIDQEEIVTEEISFQQQKQRQEQPKVKLEHENQQDLKDHSENINDFIKQTEQDEKNKDIIIVQLKKKIIQLQIELNKSKVDKKLQSIKFLQSQDQYLDLMMEELNENLDQLIKDYKKDKSSANVKESNKNKKQSKQEQLYNLVIVDE